MINPAALLVQRVVCDSDLLEVWSEPADHHLGALQTFSIRIQRPVFSLDDDIEEVPMGTKEAAGKSVGEALLEHVAVVFGHAVAQSIPHAITDLGVW